MNEWRISTQHAYQLYMIYKINMIRRGNKQLRNYYNNKKTALSIVKISQ